jgi:hypothetical protein
VQVGIDAEGRVIADTYRFGHKLTQPVPTPPLSTWIVDADGYAAFLAGEPFSALGTDAAEASEGVVVLVGNPAALSTAAVGTLHVQAVGVAPEAFTGPAALDLPFALEAGEWIAIQVGG